MRQPLPADRAVSMEEGDAVQVQDPRAVCQRKSAAWCAIQHSGQSERNDLPIVANNAAPGDVEGPALTLNRQISVELGLSQLW